MNLKRDPIGFSAINIEVKKFNVKLIYSVLKNLAKHVDICISIPRNHTEDVTG